MVCCKPCCGCKVCAEGDPGKCCCGEVCCKAGEFCCNGSCCADTQFCCDGVCQDMPCVTGACCLGGSCYDLGPYFTAEECQLYGGTVYSQPCSENPCPPPTGACCVGGDCSITTEANCTGVWQGAYSTCEDGNCADKCCVPQSGDCGGYAYWNCLEGYFNSHCESLGGSVLTDCGSTPVHPRTGLPLCADGGPTTVTVSVSGATVASSDYQPVADAVNSSFAIDLPCTRTFNGLVDQVTVTVSGVTVTWYIFITFNLNSSTGVVAASVIVNSTNPPSLPPYGGGSAAENHGTVLSASYTNCHGDTVLDCTTYALSAGLAGGWQNNGGVVDFSSATISVS